MKKIIFLLIIVVVFVYFNNRVSSFVIPDDAIRLRVVANSNSKYDQKIKEQVKKELQSDIYILLNNVTNITNAREIIHNNLDYIDKQIECSLKEKNYFLGHKVNYGFNYFPEKTYKGVTYPEGEYESLKVTIGEGLGNNWWCVLFPPLCLLEAEESTEVEYKFFIKEIFKKYLSI